eukprot:3796277-Rhodomonas_salina.1
MCCVSTAGLIAPYAPSGLRVYTRYQKPASVLQAYTQSHTPVSVLPSTTLPYHTSVPGIEHLVAAYALHARRPIARRA